ncbi:MAG: DUF1080 domain-containing protein [Phycisphaerales bacterium]|nr:DUF1080 domain-containing protein [Phycisphaerales bacterium]
MVNYVKMRSIVVGMTLLAGIMFALPIVSESVDADDAPMRPAVVAPGGGAQPPADAIVLFDGTGLSGWRTMAGGEAGWIVQDGAMIVKPGSGGIVSELTFGGAQVHVEFAAPATPVGEGQARGNSGVYLQARYEVQVLDSYENDTYPDGQCGAVYSQYPPLVNACRLPGEWQAYDIIFHPPVFDEDGKKTTPGTMTVLHNGVLIQDHVELLGRTTASAQDEGPSDGPLYLQDHGSPVRYRNIWVRPLD